VGDANRGSGAVAAAAAGAGVGVFAVDLPLQKGEIELVYSRTQHILDSKCEGAKAREGTEVNYSERSADKRR
jgi:hypothetical protein